LNVARHRQTLLITLYGKDEADDLTQADREAIRALVRRIQDT
jgi:hypothetical protein